MNDELTGLMLICPTGARHERVWSDMSGVFMQDHELAGLVTTRAADTLSKPGFWTTAAEEG